MVDMWRKALSGFGAKSGGGCADEARIKILPRLQQTVLVAVAAITEVGRGGRQRRRTIVMAEAKLAKPSIGEHPCLIPRWSCSARLFRYWSVLCVTFRRRIQRIARRQAGCWSVATGSSVRPADGDEIVRTSGHRAGPSTKGRRCRVQLGSIPLRRASSARYSTASAPWAGAGSISS